MYLRNLPKACKKVDILKHFSRFGDVFSAKIVKNKKKQCKGYGKVTFNSKLGYEEALSREHVILGQLITVEPFLSDKDLIQREIENSKFKIKVTGFNKSTKLETLEQFFSKFGKITASVIQKEPPSNQVVCIIAYSDERVINSLSQMKKIPFQINHSNEEIDPKFNKLGLLDCSNEFIYLKVEPYKFAPNKNQQQKMLKMLKKNQISVTKRFPKDSMDSQIRSIKISQESGYQYPQMEVRRIRQNKSTPVARYEDIRNLNFQTKYHVPKQLANKHSSIKFLELDS